MQACFLEPPPRLCEGTDTESGQPPIHFFYTYFHNSIRAELDHLAAAVRCLEQANEGKLLLRLSHLKERYKFLEQLYKYHSSVEDEVVYPALDSKVRNVTLAYSVEHQDEEYLFEQLSQLLSSAILQRGLERQATVRELVCKVEEIHITLRKHLGKEEEQLLPLLLQHFTYAEQAELVVQFLYCIPLAAVDSVLNWLKPSIPQEEQEHLLRQIRAVISGNLLLDLLVSWFQPTSATPLQLHAQRLPATTVAAAIGNCMTPDRNSPDRTNIHATSPVITTSDATEMLGCQHTVPGTGFNATSDIPVSMPVQHDSRTPGVHLDAKTPETADTSYEQPFKSSPTMNTNSTNVAFHKMSLTAGDSARPPRPPLQELAHIHASIGSALQTFACEARALQRQPDVSAAQLSSLVERHRFLRSVCMFHTISEEEVLFPEIMKLPKEVQMTELSSELPCKEHVESGGHGTAGLGTGQAQGHVSACEQCQVEHQGEVLLLDKLGRMLPDVRAYARRGRKEVADMLSQLCQVAEEVAEAMKVHMLREEQQVFPVLERHMTPALQRAMLWKTLKSMPLRLLERVMPWLVDTLKDAEVNELLDNIRMGAPPTETSLVELLTRWASRGRRTRGRKVSICEPSTSGGEEASEDTCEPRIMKEAFLSDLNEPDAKRRRSAVNGADEEDTSSSSSQHSAASGLSNRGNGQVPTPPNSRYPGFNPIDHIFQFHKALRRELQQLEQDAVQLENIVLAYMPELVTTSNLPFTSPIKRIAHQPQAAAAASVLPSTSPASALPSTSIPPSTSPASVLPSASPASMLLSASPAAKALAPILSHATLVCSTLLTGNTPAAANTPINGTYEDFSAPMDTHGVASSTLVPDAQTQVDPSSSNAPPPASPSQLDRSASNTVELTGLESKLQSEQRAAISRALQQLDGRFRFLWGIYRAHSRAEDDIVFPALESKEALMNVSHAYTLDHQQEEQLFEDLSQVLGHAKQLDALDVMLDVSMQLRRMCAAVRASVETHVRAEERELWPLFSEHFSFDEQQLLVGVIIGRTGAEVLQALLPFVTGSISEDERDAMMESLREATKNTKFDRWLECIQEGTAIQTVPGAKSEKADDKDKAGVAAVVQYLRGDDTASNGAGPEISPESSFRPGWEDIFRMNQKQLEAAVRRVCNDPNLEPDRKAYLIQNIMVSRYIVAQQRRLHQTQTNSPLVSIGLVGSASASAPPATSMCPSQLASIRTYHDPSSCVLGCQHYRRSCQLIAPCCNKPYTCRLCHNDAENHQMDRYAVTEVLCMMCGTKQAAAQSCVSCRARLAQYYCSICHLYDDMPGRSIYHCPFCNVCRLGKGLGIDYFHCMKCNMCMNLTLADCHPCREQCGESNCPLCHENLSESNLSIKALPCGHFMHSNCFAAYTRYNYTCPICSKSVGDMSVYFRMLDSLLAAEQLPPGYAGRVQGILCNDCGQQGKAPFHFVYHKCPSCRSYNTRIT